MGCRLRVCPSSHSKHGFEKWPIPSHLEQPVARDAVKEMLEQVLVLIEIFAFGNLVGLGIA